MESERIFIFKTGWCVDLDMIFYIGIPEILDGFATLKIGVYGKDTEENYITHNEPLNNVFMDISSSYMEYYQSTDKYKKDYKREKEKDDGLMSDPYFGSEWSNVGFLNSSIMAIADIHAMIYIECEMKILVGKLRNAWIRRLSNY